MITVNYDADIFTAKEDEDNGNTVLTLKPKVMKALGMEYPFGSVVEVSQGNHLDSGIAAEKM
tara:strand:- start:3089 stop:3274 length:186 start_codon:yes stop_codon:yes gene_type:complete